MKYYLTYLLFFFSSICSAQVSFTNDPEKAQFITTDIDLFWQQFDKIDEVKNPFDVYLEQGSQGVKDFIPYRIESSKNLLRVVRDKSEDYAAIRSGSYEVATHIDQMKACYQNLKNLYAEAVFPPAYFVIGAYNSGGTATGNGLIMGVEMQQDISRLPYIVAHELIHFNQKYAEEYNTVLTQSIKEGAADLIGELISGQHINETAMAYFEANEEILCKEFVEIIDSKRYRGWLYGSNGKKSGRPNDLGYSIGYKICKAYYEKQTDSTQAIVDILNISDFKQFLKDSGYLDKYMK
ncbi:MAG: DUF2268 domain-containing putative Zn-dependent protease [Bacteroidota bacterium]